MIPQAILLFILGLSIGSFLNVIIYRLPKNENLLGRSYCENCRKKIYWFDLIPLISFLILKGKCRFCKNNIGSSMPLIELITSLLFVAALFKFPPVTILSTLNLVFYLSLLSSLICIFFIDLKHEIIPDKITYFLLFLSFIFAVFNLSLVNHLLSAFFSFLFFLTLYLTTKGKGMGFGDVKLAGVLGLFFGFPKTIVCFYVAFLTGALLGIILIVWRKKRAKDTIAFGPFLVFGAILSLFFGDQLVSLLLNFLL